MQRGYRQLCCRAGVAAAAAAVCVMGFAAPASASVSANPAATPQLYPNGISWEQVRQLVQCGGTMYAVGSFTEIKYKGVVYARNNAFSFSATSPYAMTTWNPNVNGKVNSIAFNGTDCSNAYLGGIFTVVHGTTVKNIAEVSTTSTGAVVTGFGHSANGQVQTLRGYNGHILAGGYFTSVNGSTKKYFVSLSPSTGKDDGFLNLNISGNYGSGATQVYNQQISHGGSLELAEGTFLSVGGQARQQIFMLNLATNPATVTPWTSAEFNARCILNESFYVRAASWSPGDGTVYIGTTGFHPLNGSTSGPRTGLCDAAAAFPATQASVSHTWINYTGCDSLYSTAADASTAYFGGHERWADNTNGCDLAGPGAIAAPGMVGLDPGTGAVVFNPTRARGFGADDMLVTSAGLWIASDNMNNASQCAGKSGHAGICFLPY
jgi:hypothetical protein